MDYPYKCKSCEAFKQLEAEHREELEWAKVNARLDGSTRAYSIAAIAIGIAGILLSLIAIGLQYL